jgi:hypothetical protein
MLRFVALAVVGLLAAALSGCKDRYKDVIDQQVANWKEITGVLREVKDRQTMEDAEGKLFARASRYQEVSRQAKALPAPDEATLLRIDTDRPAMQVAIRDMMKELDRVKKLPNGPEFFERVQELLASVPNGSSP